MTVTVPGEPGTVNPGTVVPRTVLHGEPLTYLQRKLLQVQDENVRRCWYCEEWACKTDPCTVCHLPLVRRGAA